MSYNSYNWPVKKGAKSEFAIKIDVGGKVTVVCLLFAKIALHFDSSLKDFSLQLAIKSAQPRTITESFYLTLYLCILIFV